MAKLYEALMRASKERKQLEEKPALPVIEEVASQKAPFNMDEEMLALIESVASLLPQAGTKTVQFMGSREGKGASTIAREFPKVSASKIGLSVLLLDPEKLRSGLYRSFSGTVGGSRLEDIRRPECIEKMFRRSEDAKFFVIDATTCGSHSRKSHDIRSIQPIRELPKKRFDLIVLDSTPATDPSDALATDLDVDAVVFVFESEKVEWTTAGNVEDIGLAFVMESMERGVLSAEKVVRCLGTSILLMTPVER